MVVGSNPTVGASPTIVRCGKRKTDRWSPVLASMPDIFGHSFNRNPVGPEQTNKVGSYKSVRQDMFSSYNASVAQRKSTGLLIRGL